MSSLIHLRVPISIDVYRTPLTSPGDPGRQPYTAVRNPERRKVRRFATPPLTTSSRSIGQPPHLREPREERDPVAHDALSLNLSDLRKRFSADARFSGTAGREKTMTVPQPCPRLRKSLDVGVFQGEICSFRLHLAAEGRPRAGLLTGGCPGRPGQRWVMTVVTGSPNRRSACRGRSAPSQRENGWGRVATMISSNW